MTYNVWLKGPDKLYRVDVDSASPPASGTNVGGDRVYKVGDAWFLEGTVVAIVPQP